MFKLSWQRIVLKVRFSSSPTADQDHPCVCGWDRTNHYRLLNKKATEKITLRKPIHALIGLRKLIHHSCERASYQQFLCDHEELLLINLSYA